MFIGGFAIFELLYCVQPLLPEFAREFGLKPASASLAVSVSTVTMAATLLFAGFAAERFGGKTVMVASLIGSALATLAAALAPNWPRAAGFARADGAVAGGIAVAGDGLSRRGRRGAGAGLRDGHVYFRLDAGRHVRASGRGLPRRSRRLAAGAGGGRRQFLARRGVFRARLAGRARRAATGAPAWRA